MSDGLDPITVGVDDEGGVVMGVILGPEARLSVVTTAGGERRRVEGIDGAPEGRAEADVSVERRAVGVLGDPERQRLLLERMRIRATVAGGVFEVEHAMVSERRQHRVVKDAAPREVAHAEREM